MRLIVPNSFKPLFDGLTEVKAAGSTGSQLLVKVGEGTVALSTEGFKAAQVVTNATIAFDADFNITSEKDSFIKKPEPRAPRTSSTTPGEHHSRRA